MTVKIPVSRTPFSKTTMVRDEHGPGDTHEQVYFHTEINDDEVLERNKRIRLEGLMERGQKLPVVDSEVQFAFSMDPITFHFLLRNEAEMMQELQSRDEKIRENAARRLALKYPQLCTIAANR